MRLAPVLAVVVLAGGTVTAAQLPSDAAFVTRCVGQGGAVTVPGDLVVPAGKACALDGTTVNGTVRVQAGADLIVTGGTITGNVVLNEDAYLDAVDTSIAGNVTNRAGYGTYLEGSSVGRNYTGTGDTDRVPFLLTDDTAVNGRVNVTTGSALLESSTVGANVRGVDTEYTDVLDTVIEGNLVVTGSEFGTLVCDSEVHGNARFTGNQWGVQVGGQGPFENCAGANYIGGNVRIADNTGGVHVSDTIVRGNLAGGGNAPAPVGEGNRVRGKATGQFADLQPAATGLRSMARPAEPADRRSELETAREKRHLQAQQEASRAGAARL